MIHTGYASASFLVYALSRVDDLIPLIPDGQMARNADQFRFKIDDLSERAKKLSEKNWFVLSEIVGKNLWQSLLIRSFLGVRVEESSVDHVCKEGMLLMSIATLLFTGRLCIKVLRRDSI